MSYKDTPFAGNDLDDKWLVGLPAIAKALGVSLRTLKRKLHEKGIILQKVGTWRTAPSKLYVPHLTALWRRIFRA